MISFQQVASETDKGVETSVRDQLYRMTEGPQIPAAARERHWQCGPVAMPAVRSETYRGELKCREEAPFSRYHAKTILICIILANHGSHFT